MDEEQPEEIIRAEVEVLADGFVHPVGGLNVIDGHVNAIMEERHRNVFPDNEGCWINWSKCFAPSQIHYTSHLLIEEFRHLVQNSGSEYVANGLTHQRHRAPGSCQRRMTNVYVPDNRTQSNWHVIDKRASADSEISMSQSSLSTKIIGCAQCSINSDTQLQIT